MRELILPVCPSLTARFAGLLLAAFALVGVGCNCGITDNTVLDDDDFLPDDDDDTQEQTYDNEDCSNGLDDDGDGATDCADTDCEGNSNCAHECVAAEAITCGDVLSSNNGGAGHTDAVDTYDSCTTWDESGPEYTFSFSPTTTEEVTAVLTVAGHGNLDVFVLEDDGTCEGEDCIAYGASTVHWTASAGDDYLIVVDGYAGGQDNFSLEILCPSGGGDGENCFNGTDDDGDGDVDCDDLDCQLDPYCLDEDCANNLDDDGDGYVDCDDTECWGDPGCDVEECENDIDDNGNGLVDCDDPDCFGYPTCSIEECRDGLDNDGDGYTDCDDTDCFGDSDCIDEICGNGADDDGDGLTDCDDDECFPEPECVEEICTNGADDDADGAIDCADPECTGHSACVGEDCSNGADDDGDGAVDCDDSECSADPACNSSCTPSDTITCESGTFVGNTDTDPDATDVITTYGCTPSNENGNEIIYSYVPTASGEVTFNLTGLDADLDLFGLQDSGGCDPANCLDSSTSGGTNPESVTMTVTAGLTYYVAVDGWNNNVGSYSLDIECDSSGSPEDCTDGVDNDGDGQIDCADGDCAGAPGCTAEACADGVDNDGDGAVDCADPDCTADPACTGEICGNGADDDGDGLVDCDDTDASINPAAGSDNCFENIDNDADGDIDCDDADCTGDPLCNPGPGGSEDCTNGVDDDADGLIDCADTANCASDPACGGPDVEICDNGSDDNANGLIDCDDPQCVADPACGGPTPEICDDGLDNDGDGAIDCDDANCNLAVECGGSGGEDCANNLDDNANGDIDCDDSACLFDIFCWLLEEDCSDGTDNDGDGVVDCGDADCSTNSDCIPEGCNNTLDDDGDGDIDCADDECATAPACLEETCDNGVDDDGDGAIDCADIECSVDPACVPENCSNGADDDADGDVDCADSECAGNPVCDDAQEDCSNDADDNGDGLIDCADPTCSSDPNCIPEICWNGTDDDGDLAADCDDAECADSIDCQEEQCWNGTDDDGDGLVDCDDDDCLGWPSCDSEICDDGVDNDGDLDVDCEDTGCFEFSECIDEICDDDIDNDGDGSIDCGDDECDGTPECTSTGEICDNLTDDDGDGQVDCNDSDCQSLPACAEDCTNGIDDDGDGDIDCDDEECEGDEDCDEVGIGGTCVDVFELGCGDTDSYRNWGSGSANIIDQYNCSSWEETGPEYTYVFRPETSEEVLVCLSNESADLDLFVIDDVGGCDGNNCTGYGNNCVSWDAVAGEQYYLVVDGYEGAMGTYDIEVECPSTDEICDNGIDDDADGYTDCDDEGCEDKAICLELCQESWSLFCGSTDSYDTTATGATDQVDNYSCTTWVESGPEFAYYFQAPGDQANEVSVELNYSGGIDLDVFILSDTGIPCNSESCIEYGALSADFQTEPGEDYWIVVDGYQGDAGAYDITVDCEPVAGSEDCDNGVDDDGDGLIDCDDDDCNGAPGCAAFCDEDGAIQLNCGDSIVGDNTWTDTSPFPGQSDELDAYPCNVGNYEAPEVVYEWLSTVTGTVEIGFVDANPSELNHDIIVLDGTNGDCVNTQCIDEGGLIFNSGDFESVSGYTYYFVVDANATEANPNEGPYEIFLDCTP